MAKAKDLARQLRQAARKTMYGVGPEKVFCIGFQKTGTSSLGTALHLLGYTVANHVRYRDVVPTEQAVIGDLVARLDRYNAFQDTPWYLYYEIFYHAFPDAKFILTTREEDSWHRSMCRFFGDAWNPMHIFIYGTHDPANNKDAFVSRYRAHNDAVRTFFAKDPDRFAEVDLSRDDAWAVLSGLLECRTPRAPFPHENRRG